MRQGIYLCLIVCLCCGLSSSGFNLSHYLTQQILNQSYSDNEYRYAIETKNAAALNVQLNNSQLGGDLWLSTIQYLAKTQYQSALTLAYWYQHKVNFTTNKSHIHHSSLWLNQAKRLGSVEADIALIELTYLLGERDQIQQRLMALTDNWKNEKDLHSDPLNIRVAILLSKLSIEQGNLSLLKEQMAALSQSTIISADLNVKVNELISQIKHYSILPPEHLPLSTGSGSSSSSSQLAGKAIDETQSAKNTVSCITSLQLFASDLQQLHHAQTLIEKFNKQMKLAPFVCLPSPKYLNPQLLSCDTEKGKPITCDETQWQNVVEKTSTRHIGLVVDEGGANAHMGIVYFDLQDDVNVFSHEISHLLGFVDEYSLPKSHERCQGEQQAPFAHNVVVLNTFYQGTRQQVRAKVLKKIPWRKQITDEAQILQAVDQPSSQATASGGNAIATWRLGTKSLTDDKKVIGLFPSETCDNATKQSKVTDDTQLAHKDDKTHQSFQAFKLTNTETQLKYYAHDFPDEYIASLNAEPTRFLMPSFHYNIAFAYFQQGEISLAKYWLRLASGEEKSLERKSVIVQGAW